MVPVGIETIGLLSCDIVGYGVKKKSAAAAELLIPV